MKDQYIIVVHLKKMSNRSTDGIILNKTQNSSFRKDIFEHISTVSHTLVVGFLVFILFLCFNGEFTVFTWHPLLYTLGWTFLMLEAILVISPDNIFSKRLSFKLRVQYHWIIQVLAVGFSMAGFFIDFINKNRSNRPHFKSWHGYIGLISMCCCIPTCLNGIAALFNIELRKMIKPSINKLIHVICGIVTFITGSAAMILGLYTGWFKFRTSETSQIVCFVIIVFTTVWCCIRPLITSFNRIKSVIG